MEPLNYWLRLPPFFCQDSQVSLPFCCKDAWSESYSSMKCHVQSVLCISAEAGLASRKAASRQFGPAPRRKGPGLKGLGGAWTQVWLLALGVCTQLGQAGSG